MKATDQTAQQHSPRAQAVRTAAPAPYPTEPLPLAAAHALTRLDLRLNYPTDLYRAVTRHEVASEHTAQLAARMNHRDLTPAEFNSFEYAQDVMRETRTELAAAGRLDLIEATA